MNNKRSRVYLPWVSGLSSVCIFLMALACLPCAPTDVLASWNFESDCPNDLCGFTVTRGTATRATTLHPGEHGIKLVGDSEVEQTFTASVQGRRPTVLQAIIRCTAATTLTAQQVISHPRRTDAGMLIPPFIDVRTTALQPEEVWSKRVFVFSIDPTGSAAPEESVISLRISTQGSGDCTLDALTYGQAPTGACQ